MSSLLRLTVEHPTLLLVRTPRALKLATRLLATGLLCFVGALVFVPWQQSVQGTGRVVAFAAIERRQNIDAPIEGRVAKWHVREGMEVRRGEPLVEVVDNDPLILERLKSERSALEARQNAAKARADNIANRVKTLESSRTAALQAATSRVAMASQRIRAAQQTLEAAQGNLKAADLNFERQQALLEQGLASRRSFELAEAERVKASTEVDRSRAALQAAQAENSALDADRFKVGADIDAAMDDAKASEAAARAEEANVAAEIARLDVRLARQASQVVNSPLDGRVFRLFGGQGGEFVKAGDSLMILVPDTQDPAIEIWLDGNDVPLVTEGRKARVQFEGWPAIQFAGWPSVAVGTFGGIVSLVDSHDDGEGRFRVVIRPDPEDPHPWPSVHYLRQGMRVNAWVLLDRVRLGFELWRQFSGFPPSLKSAPDSAAGKTDGKTGVKK